MIGTTRRCALLVALLVVLALEPLRAGTVYVTAHGKTYHASRTCMSLSRAKNVLVADDATAIAHGLHECGICYRRRSATKKAKAAGPDWARPEPGR